MTARLIEAVRALEAAWESGDLASAVRDLVAVAAEEEVEPQRIDADDAALIGNLRVLLHNMVIAGTGSMPTRVLSGSIYPCTDAPWIVRTEYRRRLIEKATDRLEELVTPRPLITTEVAIFLADLMDRNSDDGGQWSGSDICDALGEVIEKAGGWTRCSCEMVHSAGRADCPFTGLHEADPQRPSSREDVTR